MSDLAVAAPPRFVEQVEAIAAAGETFAVQVRAKGVPDAELLALARAARAAIDRAGASGRVPLLINGRLDVALASRADGVHLPAAGAPPQRVRSVLGPGWIVGISTHSPEELRAARAAGVDSAIFGPVHRTPSKPGTEAPQGSAGLAAAIEAAAELPLFAIGGFTPERAARARRLGAHGVALIRGILAATDPVAAARDLAAALRAADLA